VHDNGRLGRLRLPNRLHVAWRGLSTVDHLRAGRRCMRPAVHVHSEGRQARVRSLPRRLYSDGRHRLCAAAQPTARRLGRHADPRVFRGCHELPRAATSGRFEPPPELEGAVGGEDPSQRSAAGSVGAMALSCAATRDAPDPDHADLDQRHAKQVRTGCRAHRQTGFLYQSAHARGRRLFRLYGRHVG
jgi:hypothetical protein